MNETGLKKGGVCEKTEAVLYGWSVLQIDGVWRSLDWMKFGRETVQRERMSGGYK